VRVCNRRERPASNSTDPKREHDYEIVLKPSEVVFSHNENKHTRTWRTAPGKRGVSGKGKRFQEGNGIKGERQV
jgi:hypothetical protein